MIWLKREGHHVEYSDAARTYLQPEERIHRGKMGSQTMTYAPPVITHQRDLSNEQFKLVEISNELRKINEALNIKELLKSKIQSLTSPKIDGSLRLICKNMGIKDSEIIDEYMRGHPLNQGEKLTWRSLRNSL